MADATETEQLERRLIALRKLHHRLRDEAIWGGGDFDKIWEARGVAKETEQPLEKPSEEDATVH